MGLEAQRAAVEAYAARSGLEIRETFLELETGTRKRERIEIHKALEAAKRQGAVLLIGKLGRLARSVSFISNLMDSRVDFVAVDMPQANKLTVHIMAALAEHEAELISKRTKEALAAAKVRGVVLGKPENLTEEAQRKGARANQARAQQAYRRVVGYVRELRAKGDSYRTIATRLNDEGFTTREGKAWRAAQVRRVEGSS